MSEEKIISCFDCEREFAASEITANGECPHCGFDIHAWVVQERMESVRKKWAERASAEAEKKQAEKVPEKVTEKKQAPDWLQGWFRR